MKPLFICSAIFVIAGCSKNYWDRSCETNCTLIATAQNSDSTNNMSHQQLGLPKITAIYGRCSSMCGDGTMTVAIPVKIRATGVYSIDRIDGPLGESTHPLDFHYYPIEGLIKEHDASVADQCNKYYSSGNFVVYKDYTGRSFSDTLRTGNQYSLLVNLVSWKNPLNTTSNQESFVIMISGPERVEY